MELFCLIARPLSSTGDTVSLEGMICTRVPITNIKPCGATPTFSGSCSKRNVSTYSLNVARFKSPIPQEQFAACKSRETRLKLD
eukprot:5977615-Amphidinium_carterae.1